MNPAHYQQHPTAYQPATVYAPDGSKHLITNAQTIARSSKLTHQLDRKPLSQSQLVNAAAAAAGYCYDPKSVTIRSKSERAGILPYTATGTVSKRSSKYLDNPAAMQVYTMLPYAQNYPQRPLYHHPLPAAFLQQQQPPHPTYEIPAAALNGQVCSTSYEQQQQPPYPSHTIGHSRPKHHSRAQSVAQLPKSASNRPLCRCRVMYLGSSVPHITKNGLHGIQEPLRHLYPDEQFNRVAFANCISGQANDASQSATQSNTIDISHLSSSLGIDSWLSVWSNGLLLENVDEFGRDIKRFFSIESLHYCAAVRFFDTTTLKRANQAGGDKVPPVDDTSTNNSNTERQQQDANNNNITSCSSASSVTKDSSTTTTTTATTTLQQQQHVDNTTNNRSKSMVRFLPLDAPIFQCPGMLDPNHPPMFAAIMRRTTGVKVLECHAFICRRDAAANAMVRCCTHAYADFLNAKRLSAELGYPIDLMRSIGSYCNQHQPDPHPHQTRSKSVGPATPGGGASRSRSSREPAPVQTVEADINIKLMGNGLASKRDSCQSSSFDVIHCYNGATQQQQRPVHQKTTKDLVVDGSLEGSIDDNYAIIPRQHTSYLSSKQNSGQQQQLYQYPPPPPLPLPAGAPVGDDNSGAGSWRRSRRRSRCELNQNNGNNSISSGSSGRRRRTRTNIHPATCSSLKMRGKGRLSRSLYDDFMPPGPLIDDYDDDDDGEYDDDDDVDAGTQSCGNNGRRKKSRRRSFNEQKLTQSLDYLQLSGCASTSCPGKTSCRLAGDKANANASANDQAGSSDSSQTATVQYSIVKSKRHSRSMQNLDSSYEFSASEARRLSARRQRNRNVRHAYNQRNNGTGIGNKRNSSSGRPDSINHHHHHNHHHQQQVQQQQQQQQQHRRSASFHDMRATDSIALSTASYDLFRSSCAVPNRHNRDSNAASNGYSCENHLQASGAISSSSSSNSSNNQAAGTGRSTAQRRRSSMLLGQLDSGGNTISATDDDGVAAAHQRQQQKVATANDNGPSTTNSNRSGTTSSRKAAANKRRLNDTASLSSRTSRATSATTKLLNEAEQSDMAWQQQQQQQQQQPYTGAYYYAPPAPHHLGHLPYPSSGPGGAPMLVPYYVPHHSHQHQAAPVGHYMTPADNKSAHHQLHHHHYNNHHAHHQHHLSAPPQPLYAAPGALGHIYESAPHSAYVQQQHPPMHLGAYLQNGRCQHPADVVDSPLPMAVSSQGKRGSNATKSSIATRFRCLSPPVNFFGHLGKKTTNQPQSSGPSAEHAAASSANNGSTTITGEAAQAQMRSSASTTTPAVTSSSASSSSSSSSSSASVAATRTTTTAHTNNHSDLRVPNNLTEGCPPEQLANGGSPATAADATTTTTDVSDVHVTTAAQRGLGGIGPSQKTSKTEIATETGTNATGGNNDAVIATTLGRRKKMSLLKRLSLTISSNYSSSSELDLDKDGRRGKAAAATAAAASTLCTDPRVGDHNNNNCTGTTTSIKALDGDGQQQKQRTRRRVNLFSGSLTLGRSNKAGHPGLVT